MARTILGQAILSIVVFSLFTISSLHAKEGFLFTMPAVLYHGNVSEFCMTMHGTGQDDDEVRHAIVQLFHKESGVEKLKINADYPVGVQTCRQFPVPEPGEYDLLLSNSTDIMHDLVQVKVRSNRLITLVQTDKPNYKPGQMVKFRILTILRDMKPKTGKIDSIYIMDPNESRVKQYLDVKTEGISSLEFQLGKEAKLGDWKIEVNVGGPEEHGQSTVSKFTVKEYVLPRFEVEVEPPAYILSTDKTITGTVCGKYTYGKPVHGFLSLDVCWESTYGPPPAPCHHEVVELDGCFNFTVNMTEIKGDDGVYYFYSPKQLETKAKVTEGGTGVEVTYNHSGPGMTSAPLNIELDDYSGGFFKPGLPYYGKVKVLKPDGSPAAGEVIQVTAEDYEHSLTFSRNFTSDASGLVVFALCGEFKDNTSTISINAEAIEYPENVNPFGPAGRQTMYRPKSHKQVTQWFSPSLSYLQIPRPEAGHRCGERLTLNVAFTTRTDVSTEFNYHVMSRGKVLQSGEIRKDETTPPNLGISTPPPSMCLNRQDVDNSRDDESNPNGPDLPMADMEYPLSVDELTPPQPETFQEPIVRSAHVSDTVDSFLLDLLIEPIMSPEFTLLVYHVMPDGEVVADSMKFDVDPCFDNTVSMEFNETQALPGQTVGLNLAAAPGSLCGVGVVDKSVNILGGDHQITPAKVLKEIEALNIQQPAYQNDYEYCEERLKSVEGADLPESDDTFYHYNSPYADASQAFRRSGMIVLTDLDLETRPCRRGPPVYYDFPLLARNSNGMPGPVPMAVDMAQNVPGPAGIPEVAAAPAPTVRSHFPETWLWDLHLVGPTGKAVLTETAPHTVTTWNGNAMCISQQKGLGLSEMTSLTTFQPFFLSVNMPYAAVRSERLPVMLTVYNYLEKCITVQLSLDLEDTFKVHNSRQYRSPICVCGGKSFTAKYYVTPRSIGTHPVIATASVVAGRCRQSVDIDLDYVGVSDQVHRKMLVKAEGVEQSYTHSSYLCPKGDGRSLEEEVLLSLPDKPDMVKHSARAEVQVIGDIMGPALSNLNQLVRMPTGCGEQNMVGFVPNILVLDYLTSTGALDEKTETTAKKNMEAGYQRELNYRHRDGSFSAFGEKDPAGSVWLTAFVVKSFAQAQKYVFIDEKDLEKSITFLRRSQLETGCYRETGKVFSSYMMGGLGTGRKRDTPHAALTAYVLVALLQAGVDTSSPAIASGLECMNREFRSRQRKMDSYTAALVAYANMLHDPESDASTEAFNFLSVEAKGDASSTYWSRGNLQPPTTSTWFYTAAPSAEVEMTSYALMANLLYHRDQAVEQTHGIAMWLTRQRNAQGGFASTQDTVVGLDALSKFAALAYTREPTELQVLLTTNNGTTTSPSDLRKMFNVSDSQGDTRFLLQSVPVTSLPATLYITAQGTGCALVQANVRYNKLPKAYLKGSRPKFFLKVKAKAYQHDSDRCDRRSVTISIGARRGHKFSKGMGLASMRMVTGWSPVADSIAELTSQFPTLGMKRIDHDEDEGLLTFYFDEFTRKAKHFTLDIEQDRELKVSRPKPAEVKVFEYYETDVANVQSYRIRTTCGTKAEIPRRPKQPPMPGTQARIDFDFPGQVRVGRVQQRRTSTAAMPSMPNIGCPVCHTSRQLPEGFDSIVCNSTMVYKALTGRKGAMSIKIRQDIRPSKKQMMSQFASPDMQSDCSCRLLSTQGAVKRVLIITSKKVSGKVLPLDSHSFIVKTSRKVEKVVGAALKTCPLGA